MPFLSGIARVQYKTKLVSAKKKTVQKYCTQKIRQMKMLHSTEPDPVPLMAAGLNLEPYQLEIGINDWQRQMKSKAVTTGSLCG